ncbi:LuxR C-terminal-related transcriptional regulator [Streptomyces sp. NPDC050560]|uniref:helix-turn-helix transcriptional regulator n=1 Tax=Streptomyces sp. NPDC050560 TaxID=3365630 RepID=UPI0037AD73E8
MPEVLISPTPSEIVRDTEELRARGDADAFRSLFERSGICMASFDSKLRLREANEQFHRDLGGCDDVADGREIFEFIRHEPKSNLRRQLLKLAGEWCERVSARVIAERSDGHTCPAQLTAVGVREDDGALSLLVMLQWNEPPEGHPGRSTERFFLTELDARILIGIAMGMSTVNLAAKLYLSRQGVEYHVATMLKKMKASNRAALVSRAYSLGVLTPGVWPPQLPAEFIK